MATKYFTSAEINVEFNNKTPEQRESILYQALDYMQAYNGRTKLKCIAMAMGYDNTEGLDNTWFKR